MMYTTGVLRVDELIFGFGAHANGDGCGTHGSNEWSVLFIMYFIFYSRALQPTLLPPPPPTWYIPVHLYCIGSSPADLMAGRVDKTTKP
jgi:hypothetical protein